MASAATTTTDATAAAAAPAESAPVELEDWQVQRNAYKQKGDDAFRAQQLDAAISAYSNALALDPTHAVLLSNRSAAHLKANQKSKALQDAKACLAADPTFVKGYSRLGAAEMSLGRYKDAKESFEKLLSKDATNAVALQGIKDCKLKLEVEEEAKRKDEEAQKKQEEEEQAKKEATGGGDDDDLDDFFNEVETAVAAKKIVVEEEEGPKIISNQKKDLGTAQDQMDRLLQDNYKWRNLNPFYVLDIPHTCTSDDISRRYKALSLLLHPDKCRSSGVDIDKAKEAYDQIQVAKKQLDNDDKARHVRGLVEQGLKKGKQAHASKNDSSTLHDVQQREVQRIFAQIEHERTQVEKRERKHEQRERQQEEDELEKERRERVFDKKWRDENRVEKRIGNWRDFGKKKKKKT